MSSTSDSTVLESRGQITGGILHLDSCLSSLNFLRPSLTQQTQSICRPMGMKVTNFKIICCESESVIYSVVLDSFNPMDCSQAPLSMRFPRQKTGGACHFLFQGIFPTQGLKPRISCTVGRFFTI